MSYVISQPVNLYTYEELNDSGKARAYGDMVEWDFAELYRYELEDLVKNAFPTTADDLNWSYVLEGRGRGFSLYGTFSLDDFAPVLIPAGLWAPALDGLTFETRDANGWYTAAEQFDRALLELEQPALTGEAIRLCLLHLTAVCEECYRAGVDLLESLWDPSNFADQLFTADGEFWGHTWDVVDGQAC